MSLYLADLSLKLRNSDACFWSLRKLLLFLWEAQPWCYFTLSLFPPPFLKCFFCLSPLHQHEGTQCFCTVGVGNLRRGFSSTAFRLKSLQSSIATWIKKKKKERN